MCICPIPYVLDRTIPSEERLACITVSVSFVSGMDLFHDEEVSKENLKSGNEDRKKVFYLIEKGGVYYAKYFHQSMIVNNCINVTQPENANLYDDVLMNQKRSEC